METRIQIVCFDFDQTLSLDHLHNACMEILKAEWENNPKEKEAFLQAKAAGKTQEYFNEKTDWLWSQLKSKGKTNTAGDLEAWQSTLKALLTPQHHKERDEIHVAIASRSQFPGIIQKFLEETIGFTPEEKSGIHVEAWGAGRVTDKIQHLKNILKKYGYPEDAFVCILYFDDSKEEVFFIEKKGATSVWVSPSNSAYQGKTNIEIIRGELAKHGIISLSPEEIKKAEEAQAQKMSDADIANRLDQQLAFISRRLDEGSNPKPINDILRWISSVGDYPINDLSAKIVNKLEEVVCPVDMLGNPITPVKDLVARFNGDTKQYQSQRMAALLLQVTYTLHPEIKSKKRGQIEPYLAEIKHTLADYDGIDHRGKPDQFFTPAEREQFDKATKQSMQKAP